MINGRPNAKSELAQQRYMSDKIQPVVSQVVMELLETKPKDPVPKMYNILHRMTEERKENNLEQAKADRGELLTDEEWDEYQALLFQKKAILAAMHAEIADTDQIITTIQDE